MVFESFVERLLKIYLGKYVDGLDVDSLSVGVWSGDLSLEGLTLKPGALDELRLPVNVSRGFLQSLTVQLPGWTPAKLSSEPVQITLDGLYIIASPQISEDNPLGMDLQAAKRQEIAVKRAMLIQAELLERSIHMEAGDDDSTKDTFLDRLFTTIIRNIQITIRNVHIRYEDRHTIPSHPFVFGMTISEMSAHTIDSDGEVRFVAPEHKDSGLLSHKKLNLESFSLYFNADVVERQLWDNISDETELIQRFGGIARNDVPADCLDHKYVLYPLSVGMTLQFHTITSTANEADLPPKYTVSMAVGSLQLALQRNQIDSCRLLLDSWSAVTTRKQVASVFESFKSSRPDCSPAESPREWWRYAGRVVVGLLNRESSSTRISWERILQHSRDRAAYVALWKRHIGADQRALSWVVPLGPDERTELEGMEDRMALEHVLAFRTIAGHEVSAELEKKSALDSTRDVSLDGGGWWGTIFGSSPEVDAGAFRLNEEERKGLFKAIDWDGSMRAVILPSDYVSTRLTLDLEYAGLDLHDGDTSLTSCSVAGSVMVERRP
eukprot:1009571_1